MRLAVPCLGLLLCACADSTRGDGSGPRSGADEPPTRRIAPGADVGSGGSGAGSEAGVPSDASDAATLPVDDAATRPANDAELPPDASSTDAEAPPPPPLDAGPVVPPGRRACTHGPGWTLFAVQWSGGSSSARVDHWDAPCDYSIRINDACGAYPRCGDAIANCGVAVVDGGDGLLLDGMDDLLFRFSVVGLRFAGATLYFQARGTRGPAQLEIWSPIYGGLAGPVDGFDYEGYELDWSDFLQPGDEQGMTGIRFDALNGNVAIHAVELCLLP